MKKWHNLKEYLLFTLAIYVLHFYDLVGSEIGGFQSFEVPVSPVYVVLAVHWEVKVEHQRHLLYVHASGQEVCADEDTARAWHKLLHDHLPFPHLHVAMLWEKCWMKCLKPRLNKVFIIFILIYTFGSISAVVSFFFKESFKTISMSLTTIQNKIWIFLCFLLVE